MRFAVVGAGAMGSLYAGMLARAGEDVWLVGRHAAHADAILAAGLRMTIADDVDWRAHPHATVDMAEPGIVDVVLFLTKTHDVGAAAAAAKPMFGSETLAVSLQNGLGAPEAIAAALGSVPIAAGVSEVGGDIVAPGHLEMTANVPHGTGRTTIGVHAGSVSRTRLEAVAAVLDRGGLPTVVLDDIDAFVWTKLAFAGTMSSISALTRLRIGPIAQSPEGRRMIERLFGEIVAVAHARGIALDLDAILARAHGVYGSVPGHVPSMAADLRAGRRTEVAALTGAVAREGERLGVPVPVCAAVADMIALVEAHPGESIW